MQANIIPDKKDAENAAKKGAGFIELLQKAKMVVIVLIALIILGVVYYYVAEVFSYVFGMFILAALIYIG